MVEINIGGGFKSIAYCGGANFTEVKWITWFVCRILIVDILNWMKRFFSGTSVQNTKYIFNISQKRFVNIKKKYMYDVNITAKYISCKIFFSDFSVIIFVWNYDKKLVFFFYGSFAFYIHRKKSNNDLPKVPSYSNWLQKNWNTVYNVYRLVQVFWPESYS